MQTRGLKATAILLFTLLLTSLNASAATTGSNALALAALVGPHSPVVGRHDKRVLARLFDGHTNVLFPSSKNVEADAIDCIAGNVDITAHSCKLTFGSKTAKVSGRKAHELYATRRGWHSP